jgi:uncharacterized membrane protein YfcA
MDLFEAASLLVLATMAAFVQSVSGFGFSLFIVPPLAMLIGPAQAVVVSNSLALFNNGYTMTTARGHIEWRLWLVLTVAAAAGMPFGLLIIRSVDAQVIRIGIAVVVLFSTLLIWRGFRIRTQSSLLDVTTGFVSGVLNTTTSMNGPPVVLYMQGKGMLPAPFRATIAAYFLASGLIAVGLFTLDGQVTGLTMARAGISIPGIIVGWLIGNRVFQRMGPERFRSVVIGVLLLSAVIALVTTLA